MATQLAGVYSIVLCRLSDFSVFNGRRHVANLLPKLDRAMHVCPLGTSLAARPPPLISFVFCRGEGVYSRQTFRAGIGKATTSKLRIAVLTLAIDSVQHRSM